MKLGYVYLDDVPHLEAEEWKETHLPMLPGFFKWWLKEHYNVDTVVRKLAAYDVDKVSLTLANEYVYNKPEHKDADLVVILHRNQLAPHNRSAYGWWDTDRLVYVTWENPWLWRYLYHWRILPSWRLSHELEHWLKKKILDLPESDWWTAVDAQPVKEYRNDTLSDWWHTYFTDLDPDKPGFEETYGKKVSKPGWFSNSAQYRTQSMLTVT